MIINGLIPTFPESDSILILRISHLLYFFYNGSFITKLSHRRQPIVHLPSRTVKVVDATGAGDSFWAGFLTALLDEKPLEHCLRFAREVAEIKLQTIGPLPANLDRRTIYVRLEKNQDRPGADQKTV